MTDTIIYTKNVGGKAKCVRFTPRAERSLITIKALYKEVLGRPVTNTVVIDRALMALEAELERRLGTFTKAEVAASELALFHIH